MCPREDPGAMATIFISYARKDRDRVRPLAEALRREGFEVFWDVDLIAGENWRDKLEEMIDRVDAVVVVWTERSVGSTFVKEECGRALAQNKLVPVRFDDVRPPLPFDAVQSPKMLGWAGDVSDEGYQALLTGVRAKIGRRPDERTEQALKEHQARIAKLEGAYGYRDRVLGALDDLELKLEGAQPPRTSGFRRAFSLEL